MTAIDPLEAYICPWDEKREIVVLETLDLAVAFATEYWVKHALAAIKDKGWFYVALSGGSTPNAIYKLLASSYRDQIDWSRIKFFWSDERCVPHDHPESNYGMAMAAGLNLLPIPPEHIFPMPTHFHKPEESANDYEETIKREIPKTEFDYMMLGMGEDGHTASLFPRTHALDVEDRLAVANYVPSKQTWRLTLTYPLINNSRKSVIHVAGANKAEICHQVLQGENNFAKFPVQKVGTEKRPVLWILDQAAASQL